MAEIIIEAEDIKKIFKTSSGDVCALNGIDAQFESGLFYAIIGKSGSGKSTLLQILGGLDRPTSGKISINGAAIEDYSDEKMAIFRRRHMGFVFQQFNLLDEYTVLNNILMPLKLDGKKPDKQFLEEITALLGIADKLKKYPGELSGGQQQRVAIARALAMEPELLLLDEPTSALDPELVGEVLDTIKKAANEGYTMLLVSHEMNFVKNVATRVIFLENGKIIEDGPPKEVFNHPKSDRVREFFAKINRMVEPEYSI